MPPTTDNTITGPRAAGRGQRPERLDRRESIAARGAHAR
jgi:hypothetical protein